MGRTALHHQAPLVARNLVMCSQHNPWLREKLVSAMAGEGPLMNVMMFASLGAAVFSYVVPRSSTTSTRRSCPSAASR